MFEEIIKDSNIIEDLEAKLNNLYAIRESLDLNWTPLSRLKNLIPEAELGKTLVMKDKYKRWGVECSLFSESENKYICHDRSTMALIIDIEIKNNYNYLLSTNNIIVVVLIKDKLYNITEKNLEYFTVMK